MTTAIMNLEDSKSYSNPPSPRSIAAGTFFGTSSILCSRLMNGKMTSLPTVPLSGSLIKIIMIALKVISAVIIAPLIEEHIFRKDLDNPTFKEIVFNSLSFGLMHALLPGSLQIRIFRVISSSIGGLFYCGARIVGGDTWSSAVAHSMYNTYAISQVITWV